MNPTENDVLRAIQQNEPTVGEKVTEHMQTAQQVENIISSNQTSLAKFFLEDDSIPEDVRAHFSVFADKELALTNIQSQEQAEYLMLHLNNAINDYRIYTPAFKQTADLERKIGMLKAKFIVKILRSMGGNNRERTQWNTVYTSTERTQPQPIARGGKLSRIRGMFL